MSSLVPKKQSRDRHNADAKMRRFSLRFRDPTIERSFTETRYLGSRNMIRGACALGALLLLAFLPLDRVFVPADQVNLVRLLRVTVLVPSLLAGLAATFLLASHAMALRVLAIVIILHGAMWSVMLVIGGSSTTTYFYPNVIVTILFAYFMLGQPFRYALPITWGIALVHIATMMIAFPELGGEQLLASVVPILTIGAITTYAAYQIHATARELYLQSVELRNEKEAREEADNSRLDWLENMARFLRHELRNTMIGISSSLELLNRKGVGPDSEIYLHRARRSVEYMRKLVADSAEATSLEVSLKQDQPGPLELSDWLADQIEVYRQSHEGQEFQVEIKTRAIVATTEERVTQLLDKLVSNAIEHANPDSAISIKLTSDGKDALLIIADRGDALPADKEAIFGLFSSSKTESSGRNIGLGLHIARLIAEAHGGGIRCVDLVNPPGAQFEVRLPMGYFNMRNRAGRELERTRKPRTE